MIGQFGGLTFDMRTSTVHTATTGTNVVAKATSGTLAGVVVGTGGAGSLTLMDGANTLMVIDTTTAREINAYYQRFSNLSYTKTGTADITLCFT